MALEVLAWAGIRKGRAVTQGPRDLDEVLETGVLPMPDRETATYPLLTAAVDEFITQWHGSDKKHMEVRPRIEGVSVHITASTSTGRTGAAGTHTRPDLTAVRTAPGLVDTWVHGMKSMLLKSSLTGLLIDRGCLRQPRKLHFDVVLIPGSSRGFLILHLPISRTLNDNSYFGLSMQYRV